MRKCLSLLLVSFCLGCVARHVSPSFDGFGSDYEADGSILAQQTADEIAKRHAPAHTSISLEKAPGHFGEVLEQRLRGKGFAVSDSGKLVIKYTLGVLDHENSPSLGYVQVACSDGQNFSVTREVFKGTTPPVESENKPAENLPQAVSEKELPKEERSTVENQPESKKTVTPVGAAVPKEPATASTAQSRSTTASVALNRPTAPVKTDSPVFTPQPDTKSKQADSAAAPRTYVVTKNTRADKLARKLRLPVDDFCRWNQVGHAAMLLKGYKVFISAPPEGTLPDFPESCPDQSAPSQNGASQTVLTPPAQPTMSPPASSAVPPKESVPAALPPVDVYSDLPAGSVWAIEQGKMLRTQLEIWSSRAGYSLIWNATNDYELRGSAEFSGTFIEAITKLFTALQQNGLALRVTVYQGNKVVEVSDH